MSKRAIGAAMIIIPTFAFAIFIAYWLGPATTIGVGLIILGAMSIAIGVVLLQPGDKPE
jgi:hypothetical protein